MSNKIITISREFGSGGRTIGKMTAQRLGIACYDENLIERIAEKSGFDAEYIKERGEHLSTSSKILSALSGRDAYGRSFQDTLYEIQSSVIIELAKKEPCVIVGRCADYVLRDSADCLTAFIHADAEKRAERVIREYGERSESIEKRLTDKDKRRKSYYEFYADNVWGDAKNYHISLNSGIIGIERCAEILAELY